MSSQEAERIATSENTTKPGITALPSGPPSDPPSKFAHFRSHFGVDIGGSLAKVVFYEPGDLGDNERRTLRKGLSEASNFITSTETYGGTGVRDARLSYRFPDKSRLHFIIFETRRMSGAFELLKENSGVLQDEEDVGCTGGGAYKYGPDFEKRFNVRISKYDEMECLLTGLNFLLNHVPDECFGYEGGVQTFADPRPFVRGHPLEQKTIPHATGDGIYPYLLVNVGSGISFLRCDSPTHFERVMGSAIGGATFWGLVRSLTDVRDYDEAMRLAVSGNADNVNMTVGDIYGGDLSSYSLPRNMTASFFGKAVSQEPPLEGASAADICNALLFLVSNNIGQLSFLTAQRFDIPTIYFSGNFLRGNDTAMQALHRAVKFWSQGKIQSNFLRHEGYFGALGVFLLHNNFEE